MTAARELKPTPRETHIARLGRLVGELAQAGDFVGAQIAAEQLARLVSDDEAPVTSTAQVIDLAQRRNR